MIYFYYNDLLQPSDHLDNQSILESIDLDNFRESLDKKHGVKFNNLINILNLEEVQYSVSEGFDYKSDDNLICNFEKISFVFDNTKDIDSILEKYGLDGVFNILKKKNKYTFTIK